MCPLIHGDSATEHKKRFVIINNCSILSKTMFIISSLQFKQKLLDGLFIAPWPFLPPWHTFCPICKLALIAMIVPKRLCLAINQEKWTHSSSVYVADPTEWTGMMILVNGSKHYMLYFLFDESFVFCAVVPIDSFQIWLRLVSCSNSVNTLCCIQLCNIFATKETSKLFMLPR